MRRREVIRGMIGVSMGAILPLRWLLPRKSVDAVFYCPGETPGKSQELMIVERWGWGIEGRAWKERGFRTSSLAMLHSSSVPWSTSSRGCHVNSREKQ